MKNRLLLSIIIVIGVALIGYFYLGRFSTCQPVGQEGNRLVVGTNTDFPPFSFIDNDQITGFDIELIKEVAKRLGKDIELKNMRFEALIPQIQLGSIAVIAAGMTPTPERAERVIFMPPHLTADSLAIVSLASTPVHTINELVGKTVVVNQGYTADAYASSLPDLNVLRLSSDSVGDALLALQGNRAHGYITAQNTVKTLSPKMREQFFVSPIPGTNETVAFAVSKKYPALATQIEVVMKELVADGTIDTLKKKWNLQ